jgi:hypothetical protein
MIIRFHYNKHGAPKGMPWTLHTSKGCFPASHVVFQAGIETEEKPEKKANPRYFLKCDGDITWEGTVATVCPRRRA